MSDTLIDDDDTLQKHFVCDCGATDHSMSVLLDKNCGEVLFEWDVSPVGIMDKLKDIFGILTGKGRVDSEFILRSEDISELVELLEKANEGK